MEEFPIKKIEPHFYYNALEYINALAIINNIPEVSEVTVSLGKMMRYWTDNDEEFISLKDELDYIEEYLIITRLRYDSCFEFKVINCEDTSKKCAKYVLEPLISEIINGIMSNSENDVKVYITVSVVDDKFIIFIKDCLLTNLREVKFVSNMFIYGEKRLKVLTSNDISIDYKDNDTIITYLI